jgi:hypothetical protein
MEIERGNTMPLLNQGHYKFTLSITLIEEAPNLRKLF